MWWNYLNYSSFNFFLCSYGLEERKFRYLSKAFKKTSTIKIFVNFHGQFACCALRGPLVSVIVTAACLGSALGFACREANTGVVQGEHCGLCGSGDPCFFSPLCVSGAIPVTSTCSRREKWASEKVLGVTACVWAGTLLAIECPQWPA